MNYYFAPLEGLTDSVYRRLHHRYFPGVDRYYTPFFSPTVHRSLTPKEQRELPPADSEPFCVIPQILTKNAEDFLWFAGQCKNLGYTEVNLNLGCPSGTVTAKGKGAGMLRDLEGLDRFLQEIYEGAPLDISVKTRLGFSDPEEFPRILEILNRYPVKELTLHPRVRSAFYSGDVDIDAFRYALENSKNPLCYNGNLCSKADITAFRETFPQIGAVMLGRGLVGDPGMLTPDGTNRENLQAFMDSLLQEYTETFGGPRNAMFRMKENWHYLIRKFDDSDKLWKRLRKTTDLHEYKAIPREIFATLPMRDTLSPDW